MTDDFLTKGLQEDRYLKAIRLISQFEEEIVAMLHELDERMVEVQPDLFNSSVEPDVNTNRTPANGLAFTRINHSMTGPQAPDNGQMLNVHLYWMPPTEYERTDIDGAIRGFGYKVKNADTDIDDRVVEQMQGQDWSLETSSNPYDPNTVFYRHVSSTAEIEETAETLVEHFKEFGGKYTADFDEQA